MEKACQKHQNGQFEAPGIKEWDFMTVWILKKIKKICMEKVAGEQGSCSAPTISINVL